MQKISKIIQGIKKNKSYFFAFFLPFFVVGLLFAALLFLLPNGNSITISDMEQQYLPLMVYFKNHLFELFSFSKDFGSNMIGTLAYYLMSPFNFISLFFSAEKMDAALLLIVWLKLSIAGFTSYLFFQNHFKTKEKGIFYVFSLIYVLSGFTTAYFFNIIWLDAVYMLPIVMIGIERLMKKKKSGLYLFSLGYTILTNYYMGYIVCIFSCLYFIYQILLNYQIKKDFKKIKPLLIKFFFASLFAGLLCSFLLIPTLKEMPMMARSYNETLSNGLGLNISISQFFVSLFMGTKKMGNVLSNGYYNIYIGMFALILVFFYFINKKIKRREKVLSFSILAIFIFSMFINVLDFVWHGFTETSSFPGRYTFIFIFFCLMLACKSYLNLKKVDIKQALIIFLIIIFMALVVLLAGLDKVPVKNIFISVVLVFLYLLLLGIKPKYKDMPIFKYALYFIVVLELIFNFYDFTSNMIYPTKREMRETYQIYNKALEEIKSQDLSFYRVVDNFEIGFNNSFRFDFNSFSSFLSTQYIRPLAFAKNNNYVGGINNIYYNHLDPVIDSLLGIKYIFYQDGTTNYYDLVGKFLWSRGRHLEYNNEFATVNIYQNSMALGLGYASSNKVKNMKINDFKNSFDYSNQMVNAIYGEDINLYEKQEKVKIRENEYKFTVPNDGAYYFILDPSASETSVYANDQKLYEYKAGSVSYALLNLKKGYTYTIRLENKNWKGEIPFDIYVLNQEKYKQVFTDLQENNWEINYNKNGYLKGLIDIPEGKEYMFTTIGYDEGFQIYVDGKLVDYDLVFDTFIGFPISSGDHIVEIMYVVPGLNLGFLVSGIALIGTIFFLRKEKK